MASHRLRTAGSTPAAVAFGSLLMVIALHGACTKVPLTAPSGTVIALHATTNVLPINGSTDIIAVLIRSGQQPAPSDGTGTPAATATPSTGTPVHNGTVVSFTTTLGTIEPSEAKTTGGQVTVKLVGDGRSGVATITAYSGGASQTLAVNIGAAAAARVLVSASPQELPPTGGTTTVTATVQDQQGNPIAGVPVTFSTSAGSLNATGAVTDAFGNATTMLTTNAAATVTASAGGGTSGTLSGTVAITIQPNSSVTLTPPTGVVTVSAPVTFTVGVGSGVIATKVVIDFGDGTRRDLGAITQSQSVAHVYSAVRTYTVTATGTFADGSTKSVSTDVVVAGFTVQASCGGNVVLSGTSTLIATVTPNTVQVSEYHWSVPDGSSVSTLEGGPQVQYTWQARGTHVVTLTVVPTNGPSANATCSLEVN